MKVPVCISLQHTTQHNTKATAFAAALKRSTFQCSTNTADTVVVDVVIFPPGAFQITCWYVARKTKKKWWVIGLVAVAWVAC